MQRSPPPQRSRGDNLIRMKWLTCRADKMSSLIEHLFRCLKKYAGCGGSSLWSQQARDSGKRNISNSKQFGLHNEFQVSQSYVTRPSLSEQVNEWMNEMKHVIRSSCQTVWNGNLPNSLLHVGLKAPLHFRITPVLSHFLHSFFLLTTRPLYHYFIFDILF